MTKKELDEAMGKDVTIKFFERYRFLDFYPSTVENFAATLFRAYRKPFYMDSRLIKQLPDSRPLNPALHFLWPRFQKKSDEDERFLWVENIISHSCPHCCQEHDPVGR